MANKKKNVVDYKKVYNKFSKDVDDVLYLIHNLKENVFEGNISHKDMIDELFSISYKLGAAFETAENVIDPYNDDEDFI